MTRVGTWQLNVQTFANFWTKNCCWIVCSLSLWFGSRRGSFHFYQTSPEPPAELSESTVADVKSFFSLWKIIQNMTEQLGLSASAFLVYSLTYKRWTNWKLLFFSRWWRVKINSVLGHRMKTSCDDSFSSVVFELRGFIRLQDTDLHLSNMVSHSVLKNDQKWLRVYREPWCKNTHSGASITAFSESGLG